jgi:ferredoxin
MQGHNHDTMPDQSDPSRQVATPLAEPATGFRVRLEPAGLSFTAPADASLLLAAARANISLPSSCRNGTCRTCLCRLLEGQIDYAIEWPGVSFDERAEGLILPCVARARSDLVLDAPAAAEMEQGGPA